jgi:hypothetical protein
MSHTDTYKYDPDTMWDNFARARYAVRFVHANLRRAWSQASDDAEYKRLDDQHEARKWIVREVERYPLHLVIEAAVKMSRPYDWHQLFLEWPHTAQGDRSKIAYTQNEDKGRRDIQTVTSVGKYLRRHFPDLSDHDIRDLVSRYGSADTYKFVHTTAEMIYHLERGPSSCMVWSEDRAVRCTDGVARHPYEAYNPKYGWHMAVRLSGDETVGRALCMQNPDCGTKYYVRSYARPSSNGGYSETDNGMENWLKEQGYLKHSYWEDGEKLAYHETRDDFLAPYLDGSEKRVRIEGGCVVIDSEGEYACDQTGGSPTELNDDTFECAQCGDDTDDDDGYWVGRGEDERVCQHCLDNDYVYAYGRRGNQYYIPSDDAVYVESQSEWYDPDYLSDNEIVELTNGEYLPMDEAIEVNGDWYHIEDERICLANDTDEYCLKDDCWQCAQSCNWYSDDCEDYTEYEGERYHDDYIPKRIADATADDAEDEADTAVAVDPVVATLVVPKQLTIEMLNACALWEQHDAVRQRVTYSIGLLHNGVRLYAERSYRDGFIESQGADWMRMNVRRVLSNELLGLPQSSTETI